MEVNHLDLPVPKIGNKIFCVENHGTYVFERDACTWRAMANTRTGNGTISMYDGVPEPNGSIHKLRKVFRASILGMWMFDGGCDNGLTLVCEGSGVMTGGGPCVTVTWMPAKTVQRKIEVV